MPASASPPRQPGLPTRFQWHEVGSGAIECIDRLVPGRRSLVCGSTVAGAGPEALGELLRRGFMQGAMPAALRRVADRPRHRDDALFWQFPARTEAAASERHALVQEAPREGSVVHTYLGLPWATWIDQRLHPLSRHHGSDAPEVRQELMMQRVRISGLRRALRECGLVLRVHTVCQHIEWRAFLPEWQMLGVSDLWLSHAPVDGSPGHIALHPWRLYAVNVEEPDRTEGLQFGRDPSTKPLLASFVGAHMPHYLSDVRLRLRAFAGHPRMHVHVTDKWHFEDAVYQHQIGGRPLAGDASAADAVRTYNRMLSDSVFALCPAGAGRNTLRLWEALAVGSVPVILGPAPQLPRGGSLPAIDWDAIVLRIEDQQLPELPHILASWPMEDVRRRQALGMAAFAQVRAQCCFLVPDNPST